MSDLYTSLNISPRKKRSTVGNDDDQILTPKKLRTAPPTPQSRNRDGVQPSSSSLPPSLARLYNIHTALQNALSHALATCAVSPSSDTGHIRNVLNHLSLTTYTGFTTKLGIDDIKRLCWLWEWNGESVTSAIKQSNDDENPFLETQIPRKPNDWTRGSMGFILSPTTHFSKAMGKRVPAYGVGIEVEMDEDKGMGGGMAAVARWTAAGDTRRTEFRNKLERWIEIHFNVDLLPNIPLADLPQLVATRQPSSLTLALASASPKGPAVLNLPAPPPSPTSSPKKSPVKHSSANRDAAELPVALPKPSTKNSVAFPQTPSRGRSEHARALLTPSTQRASDSITSSTPTHQTRHDAPQTPNTSRRQALYERVRQRSLSASPTKARNASNTSGGNLTRDQLLRLGQEEMRRRCLLGRLAGVAESVWMLFSSQVATSTNVTPRKRRALPSSEVAQAVMKSSPVPMSIADVNESLTMLTNLCPFFLKKLEIASEEWFEMPASNSALDAEGSAKESPRQVSSPSLGLGKHESAEEILNRSPRRVKREGGGLREVREIVRRELELTE